MRCVISRVRGASVRVEGEIVGEIGLGLLVLLAAETADGPPEVSLAARKIASARLFPRPDAPERYPMDRSVIDVGGEILLVSQFTLAARLDKGRRPSFHLAQAPELAATTVDEVAQALGAQGVKVARGVFGAHMEVAMLNQGPVTCILEIRDGAVVGP